jgi:hypothetical protein
VATQAELYIVTPRTLIVRTPTEAIERRLEVDDFFADVDLGPAAEADGGDRVASVHFPPSGRATRWPASRRGWRGAAPARRDRGWAPSSTAARWRPSARWAAGRCPTPTAGRGSLRHQPGQRDRGIATEAGGAFVAWLLSDPR